MRLPKQRAFRERGVPLRPARSCYPDAVGGVLKDIYRLPRPPPLLVWRDFAAGDSTGAKDFGFVSTHTANAVTNSFGLLL